MSAKTALFRDPQFLAARGLLAPPIDPSIKQKPAPKLNPKRAAAAGETKARPAKKMKKRNASQGNKASNSAKKKPKSLRHRSLTEFKSDERLLRAIDCEMVTVKGPRGIEKAVARVSIVDHEGKVLLDSFVKPDHPIQSLHTRYSGIRWKHIKSAPSFREVQVTVRELLLGKKILGHAVLNDFEVLKLYPSDLDAISYDTAKSAELQMAAGLQGPMAGLKKLSKILLSRDIQEGEHDSVIDATATLDLFKFIAGQEFAEADSEGEATA